MCDDDDLYSVKILRQRYNDYKKTYMSVIELNQQGFTHSTAKSTRGYN